MKMAIYTAMVTSLLFNIPIVTKHGIKTVHYIVMATNPLLNVLVVTKHGLRMGNM